MSDQQIKEAAVNEAQDLIPELQSGGEAKDLAHSTSGLLRVGRSPSGELYIAGAGNSEWLQRLAQQILERLAP